MRDLSTAAGTARAQEPRRATRVGRWSRRLAITGAAAALGVFVTGAPAQASTNSGWVYTTTYSGAGYFDADLDGYPGVEKLTVCDNVADGRGIVTFVFYETEWTVMDPKADGNCVSDARDRFPEEEQVKIQTCEYHYNNDSGSVLLLDNCRTAYAYS